MQQPEIQNPSVFANLFYPQVPIPPQLKEDFEMVKVGDCVQHEGNVDDLYNSLQEDLLKQLKVS